MNRVEAVSHISLQGKARLSPASEKHDNLDVSPRLFSQTPSTLQRPGVYQKTTAALLTLGSFN